MRTKTSICFFIACMAFSAETVANEYFRLAADLDGDNKTEIVTVSTSGTGDFQSYIVQVANATFSGNFFAVDGDLPEIKLTRVNGGHVRKLLLVTVPDPTACVYELLSFTQGRLVHLLKTSSKDCDAPIPWGNGQIRLLKWEGFWKRPEIYDLDKQGLRVTLEVKTLFSVGIPGVGMPGYAMKLSYMQPDNCEQSSIREGSFVLVKKYDIVQRRYLIKNLDNACGWVPEEQMFKAVGGLPWGGQ